MRDFLRRYKWWVLALVLLVVLNVVGFWPSKHASRGFAGGPPMMDGKFHEPDAAMQARIDALPEPQRTAIETRMNQDRQFFASIQNLPEDQRRQMMQQHFAQNPPP